MNMQIDFNVTQRDPKDRSGGLQHQPRPVGAEAQDRDKWRAAVNKGAKQSDEEEQNQQISRSHHYCLFTLPEDVSINGEAECFLSFIYDENTTQNGHLPCKSYKFIGNCGIDAVYNRYTAVCSKCSPTCDYKGCSDIRLSHGNVTGQYSLTIGGSTVPVRCDMDIDGGGWIVIQRRLDGSVNFYRGWSDYKNGFGSPSGEYWLGLENLHTLTSEEGYMLRIDMEYNDQSYYALYSGFTIASESDNYRMGFSTFLKGNTGDSLGWHNGQPFTTYDQDHDDNVFSYGNPNCAIAFYGAWWYAGCHSSNLNGHFGNTTYGKGINWSSITGFHSSLSKVEMKIKKNR
ncbi:microfibril-associated glycoprotein 4-like [Ostrea edulis]|uniref:microfibril-associated glycoprotein 4-like n=1 Tax=Ostrea edulis TaxID=37623 RepID=UPI002094418C|nr:microfibril-associated glycoprotein 4-like [Ostrea edulis]